MALILLAFIGTLAIFFRLWRELEGLRRAFDDMRKNLQYYAVDTAQQHRDLVALIREGGRQGSQPCSHQDGQQGGENLGELLERGIPNLSTASPAVSSTPSGAPVRESFLPDIASGTGMLDEAEEDFFRRFEKKPGKGVAS